MPPAVVLLSSSSTRILLNGEPRDNIIHRRGLRQGDPLSPMLFVLVMDVLNSLVGRAAHEGHFHPFAIQQPQHRISLYADDAVLFLRPFNSDLSLVKELLEAFGYTSRLVTNLSKSSVHPIQCGDGEKNIDFQCSELCHK